MKSYNNKSILGMTAFYEWCRLKKMEKDGTIRDPKIIDVYKEGDELHIHSTAIYNKPIKFIKGTLILKKNFDLE